MNTQMDIPSSAAALENGVARRADVLLNQCAITAEPIKIQWNPSLQVFAKEEFLRAVGDEYGWLGGIDRSGTLRCVLPYTIVRKGGLRLVRFRVETMPCDKALNECEEKCFLNSVVQHFQKAGADVIIPASNNTLFRTYPDGATVAPYGSYIIDLQQPEDALWRNVAKNARREITVAERSGVNIREGIEFLDSAYELILGTFGRSNLTFMSRDAFRRLADGLSEHGKLFMAEYQGIPQSYAFFAFSRPCAYWMYGGNVPHQRHGAMKLLQWHALRFFRNQRVLKLDFFGARINPQKGSKQDGINSMKRHLGATLSEGYMWKYSLRPWRASVYSLGVRLLRGGDIVDQEGSRLKDYSVHIAG